MDENEILDNKKVDESKVREEEEDKDKAEEDDKEDEEEEEEEEDCDKDENQKVLPRSVTDGYPLWSWSREYK